MTTPSSLLKQRWMALWLPRLSTDRLTRAGAAPADRPFVCYAKIGNAFTLTAVDPRAVRAGLSVGTALADARAMAPGLVAFEEDEAADTRALDAIGAWCEHFTPIVVLDPPHGLLLDVSGCAHLFGGEAGLLRTIERRLKAQGFAVRGAIAPTPGAAWACARFGETNLVAPQDLPRALSPLPVEALRLEEPSAALLNRLGLKTIGQIIEAPRQPFSARAGQNAMLRLDQALGRAREALSPRRPPPLVFALRKLTEPVITLDGVLTVVDDLCTDLAGKLDQRGMGARRLALLLFGLDGKTRCIELGLSRPERDAKPILRLLREKLTVSPDTMEAAFGFEALRLDAMEIGEIVSREADLAPSTGRDLAAEARLTDHIGARLGEGHVGRLAPRDVHAPERASALVGVLEAEAPSLSPPDDSVMRRPLRLFAHPQLIDAIAFAPDGPPLRFLWRRVQHDVARAEGPERITPDWLRAGDEKTRDYYRVEDKDGRRFWLYREGQYGDGAPRWFLHGLFA